MNSKDTDESDLQRQADRTKRRDLLLHNADAVVDAMSTQLWNLWRAAIIELEFAAEMDRALDRISNLIERAKNEL